MRDTVVCRASPSLALVKYWGKMPDRRNVPATSSLALTLSGLSTTTRVSYSNSRDTIIVDGAESDRERYLPFFDEVRRISGSTRTFHAESSNDFPGSAGLASSSSGFACLAYGCLTLLGLAGDLKTVSSVARLGSASAARAVFGGFTALRRGEESAEELYPRSYWPELRVVAAVVSTCKKEVSSRRAMEAARTSSPFYDAWIVDAEKQFAAAQAALEKKDMEALGTCMQNSYLRMFATMISAEAPVIYWQPGSVELIHACRELRAAGTAAWETMDAGPQVKVLTSEKDLERVTSTLRGIDSVERIIVARAGEGVRLAEPDLQ